jgi:aspartate racemase
MKQALQQPIPGRLIGILGGMGPEATLDLYRHILNLTPAAKDQDHIRVLIYSNPKIPDRTKAINGEGESPLPYLIDSARLLENAGAEIIAMPCNAAHYYLPELQKSVHIPILDMTEETCKRFCERLPKARTAGLIASMGTVYGGIYHRTFAAAGIRVLAPDAAEQTEVEKRINSIKAGFHDQSTQVAFQMIGKRLFQAGAEAVILGCTEVPLAFDPGSVSYPTFNSTQILAEAAVDWALKEVKQIR